MTSIAQRIAERNARANEEAHERHFNAFYNVTSEDRDSHGLETFIPDFPDDKDFDEIADASEPKRYPCKGCGELVTAEEGYPTADEMDVVCEDCKFDGPPTNEAAIRI